MTWGRLLRARALPIAISVAVTMTSALVAPAAASAAVPDAHPASATVASTAAPSTTDALPRMDEYRAADYDEAAAALPAGLVEAAGRDLGKSGAEYLAAADAATDAVDVVAALEERGVDVRGSRLEGTHLTVSVGSAADAAVVATTGARAEVGDPAGADFSGMDFESTLDVYGGQGYVWANQDGSGGQCSVGFTGYQVASGQKQLATAGHCLAGMAAVTGQIRALVQIAPGTGGVPGGAIGFPVAGSGAFGNGYDTGLIAASAAGVVTKPSLLTWGGASSAPLSSAPLPVTGQTAAMQGADVCKSGSRTGWSCGSVLAVDEPVLVSGAEVNAIVTDACVQPGDSGGAAVSGQRALGIVSGSTGAACGDPSQFSVLFPMVSAGGVSVSSKYGGTWEPAVTVAAPVVTNVTAGTTGAAGRISGTLANATDASRIRVYVDGSATAFATADASTGSWSVSLASLGAGAHRFSAVAGWGAWSRSAAATGTVTVTAVAAAGDIVRAPGGALYLVDGPRRLVPVPSAAVAAEFTARPILDQTAAAIAGYTIDTAAVLGIAVSCGATFALAGGGQLWRLPGTATGGLPVTALDPATCATVPRSPSPVGERILLRSATSGTVFLLDSGKKHRLSNAAAVRAFGGAQPTTVPLAVPTLATIADGRELLAPAQLVTTASNRTVYLIDGMSRKIRVAGLDTPAEYGVRAVETVAQSVLDGYTAPPAALTVVAKCAGTTVIAGDGQVSRLASGPAGLASTTLDPVTCAAIPDPTRTITGAPFLRSRATGELYLVQDGRKSPVTSAAAKALNGGSVPPSVSLGEGSLARIPTGRTLLAPGTLVKAAESAVVYLIDGVNRKVPIRNVPTAAEFGRTGHTTVPLAVLNGYRPVSLGLSLGITCRSSYYVAGGGSLWRLEAGSSFGLRTTALDDRTCAAFRTSAQPVTKALFVRSTTTGAVYRVSDGARTYMPTMTEIITINGGIPPAFVPLSPRALALLPLAPGSPDDRQAPPRQA